MGITGFFVVEWENGRGIEFIAIVFSIWTLFWSWSLSLVFSTQESHSTHCGVVVDKAVEMMRKRKCLRASKALCGLYLWESIFFIVYCNSQFPIVFSSQNGGWGEKHRGHLLTISFTNQFTSSVFPFICGSISVLYWSWSHRSYWSNLLPIILMWICTTELSPQRTQRQSYTIYLIVPQPLVGWWCHAAWQFQAYE